MGVSFASKEKKRIFNFMDCKDSLMRTFPSTKRVRKPRTIRDPETRSSYPVKPRRTSFKKYKPTPEEFRVTAGKNSPPGLLYMSFDSPESAFAYAAATASLQNAKKNVKDAGQQTEELDDAENNALVEIEKVLIDIDGEAELEAMFSVAIGGGNMTEEAHDLFCEEVLEPVDFYCYERLSPTSVLEKFKPNSKILFRFTTTTTTTPLSPQKSFKFSPIVPPKSSDKAVLSPQLSQF